MSSITELKNYVDHDEFIKNSPKAVIFFGSVYCGHCREITPLFKQLSRQNPSVSFAHIETSEVEVENVSGVPVFVAYKSGVPVEIVLGSKKDKLESMVKKM